MQAAAEPGFSVAHFHLVHLPPAILFGEALHGKSLHRLGLGGVNIGKKNATCFFVDPRDNAVILALGRFRVPAL